MTKFLVQIVLHDTQVPAVYDELNAAMAKRGFTGTR